MRSIIAPTGLGFVSLNVEVSYWHFSEVPCTELDGRLWFKTGLSAGWIGVAVHFLALLAPGNEKLPKAVTMIAARKTLRRMRARLSWCTTTR
jgi:hypothetical protein